MLSSSPMGKEDLKQGIKLVYEDDTQIIINYNVLHKGSIQNNNKQDNMIKELFEHNSKYTQPLEHTLLYKLEKVKRKNIKKDDDTFSQQKMDHYYVSIPRKESKCLQVASFNPEDEEAFVDVYNTCTEMFNSNEGPIIVILPGNGGGDLRIEEDLVRTLSPTMTTFETGTFKISNVSEYLARIKYCVLNGNPETCDVRYQKVGIMKEIWEIGTINQQ